jgi:hypothetical protein
MLDSDCILYPDLLQEAKTQFWRCVQSFNAEDRQSLLHFATGMSFLPPGGFAYLSGHGYVKSILLWAK